MMPASVSTSLSPCPSSWCGNHTHEQAFFSFSPFEGRWKVFLVLNKTEPWNPSETHPDRNAQVLFIIMPWLYKIIGFTVVFHGCIYNMCWSQSPLPLSLTSPPASLSPLCHPQNSSPSNFPDYFSPLHSTWKKRLYLSESGLFHLSHDMISSSINLPENEMRFPLDS